MIADLILEINPDLTEVWFVIRRLNASLPEALWLLLSHAIRCY